MSNPYGAGGRAIIFESGAGGGQLPPFDADFVLVSSHASLTNAHVIADSPTITWEVAGSTIQAHVIGGVGAGGVAISAAGQLAAGGTVIFSNSNGLAFGMAGSTVTGSYTVPSVTEFLTTAALSNHSHGDPVLFLTNLSGTTASNSAGLTLSLSGPAPGGGAQTAISGIVASNTTYTSGTVAFSGVGGGVTINSNTGQRVDISVGLPAFSADASSTFQTLSFQNSNGVSFSNNAGALRVTHALQHTSATSAITSNALNTSASRVINVVAATNNTGGGTASLSSNVSFSNANGATFYTSAGNAVALSYTVPSVTNSSMSFSDSVTSLTLGRLAFTNLNGVTLTLSTTTGGSATLVGSHNALTSQSNLAFSADASSTFQTLSFQNSNGVSFSNNAGALRVTHALQHTSATSAITSNALNTSASRVINVVAATNSTGGGTASLSSDVSFSAANGLTFYTSAGNAIVGSYTVPSVTNSSMSFSDSATSLTLGRLAFTNLNGVTLTLSTTTGGSATLVGSHNALTSQSNQAFSADASSTFQTLSFQDSNGVSFSNNAGAIRITHGLQFTSNTSAITSNALNTSASRVINIVAATNSTGGGTASLSSNVSFSNANGATFYTSAGNAIALSYSVPTVTNSAMTVSDAATSGTLARLAFTNLNGVTLSLSTGAGGSHTIVGSHNAITSESNQTVGMYALGNTANNSSTTFDARTLSLAFGGGVTGGYTNGSLSISGQTQSTLFFSAGTTSGSPSTLVFSNANNVSFGFSNLGQSRLTASVVFNISAGTASTNLSKIEFDDSNGVAFGLNGSTITANAGFLSFYENWQGFNLSQSFVQAQSTSVVQPFVLPLPISISYLRLPITMSAVSTTFATSNNTAFSCSILETYNVVVYTMQTGASSQSLGSVASGSVGFSQQWSFSAGANGSRWTLSYKITYPISGTTVTFSDSLAKSTASIQVSTEPLSNFTGAMFLDIPFTTSLSAGNYWLAHGRSTTTSTQGSAGLTGCILTYTQIAHTQMQPVFHRFGEAADASVMPQMGMGSFSTNGGGTTASLGFSNVSSWASHLRPLFQFIRQA